MKDDEQSKAWAKPKKTIFKNNFFCKKLASPPFWRIEIETEIFEGKLKLKLKLKVLKIEKIVK